MAASSSAGRLAPRPFIIATILVYLASFASQALLSRPVTSRVDVFPFALVQAALIAVWVVLHLRRLRDAGRPGGLAIGIALIYALEIVLLVLVAWLVLTSSGPQGASGAEYQLLDFMVFLYLLTLLSGDPHAGVLQAWMMGFVVLMLLPVVIALGFSFWTAMRPSTAAVA